MIIQSICSKASQIYELVGTVYIVDCNAMFQIEALGSSSGKPSARVEVVNSGVLQTGCCCVAEQQLRCG